MMSSKGVLSECLLAERTLHDRGVVFPRHNRLLQSSKLRFGAGYRRPEIITGSLRGLWWWVRKQLSQPRQSGLQSADFKILLIDGLAPGSLEEIKVISL
jgi:hypothetical protein